MNYVLVCLVSLRPRQQLGYNIAVGSQDRRLTISCAATHGAERRARDHEFCLSRSKYSDTVPTSRERAATTGIEPMTSSTWDGNGTQSHEKRRSQKMQGLPISSKKYHISYCNILRDMDRANRNKIKAFETICCKDFFWNDQERETTEYRGFEEN